MNTKIKKKKTRSQELKEEGIVRITLDFTIKEKDAIHELNDGYIFSRKDFFKPFAEALLRTLSNHKDKKRLMKEIFNRV